MTSLEALRDLVTTWDARRDNLHRMAEVEDGGMACTRDCPGCGTLKAWDASLAMARHVLANSADAREQSRLEYFQHVT